MAKNYFNLRPDRGVFPLSELTTRSANDFGASPVMRSWDGTDYQEITFVDLHQKARAVAFFLVENDIKPGDRVAILGENSPDWAATYLGIQMAGAVGVPLDSLMPTAGVRHILHDSEARILYAAPRFIDELAEVEPVATIEKTLNLSELPTADKTSLTDDDLPKRDLDEYAVILYTSGTTGHSKGVILTQRNIMSNVAAASRIFDLGPSDTFLSVLPVHHSLECTAGFLLPVYCGSSITYSRSLKSAELMADIRNTGVTIMVAVPLLYEKIHTGMLRAIRKKGKKAQSMFNAVYGLVSAGEKIGLKLGRILFSGMREKAGLNNIRWFVSGGGPLDPDTARFFSRLGIPLIQGYGLTETSPVTHISPPERLRIITVGPTIPGVECKLIETNDQGIGEICLKGPNIFIGYFKNEDATRQVLDKDGWLKTGDLGIIHDDGYLQIVGRCKNMLVTGGGKNVYPEEIEHFLNRSLFITESLVLGIRRESGYGDEVAAMIYPDYEQLDLHFAEKGLKPNDADVYALIKSEIALAQNELEEFKRIRRFRIVEEEFQKTSTRKIKRFLYNGDMFNLNDSGD